MNIAMFTNTYLPHVGGVAESVHRLAEDCRKAGHHVYIVAPEFPDMPVHEKDVIRVPALQEFNGSDFSVSLPAPILLSQALDRFQPDIIHVHHPYLLGDTALRVSAKRNLPLIFTYHTMYEHYTHYVPTDSPGLKRFVVELATGFTNLCDHVVAPSESLAHILTQRGVTTPMTAIPTGVDCEYFTNGHGTSVRNRLGIAEDAFIIGHVGRLAPEKNLNFLADAVAQFLQRTPRAHFLVVGEGPSVEAIQTMFTQAEVHTQVHFAGIQQGDALLDHYNAMNVFVFASKTETQGMVLAEAMAAGIPVIALDAPGAREIVRDYVNGRLVSAEEVSAFMLALSEISTLSRPDYLSWQEAALNTAQQFSRENSLKKFLELYTELLTVTQKSRGLDDDTWEALIREVKQEWELWSNRIVAGIHAIAESSEEMNDSN
jgi:glycosyltransferase involved in cell wall biosynthesis